MHQCFAPIRISPDPFAESLFDCLLFLLGKCGFLLVQYTLFFAFSILDGIVDPDITEIQGILQNSVGVCAIRSVGDIGCHIVGREKVFPVDIPFCGIGGEVHMHSSFHIEWCLEGFPHEIIDILLIHPGRAKADINLGCFQILGLRRFKRLYIYVEVRRHFGSILGFPQLLADIARQVFIRSHIGGPAILIERSRHLEDHTDQLIRDFFFIHPGQLRHERQIHPRFLRDRHSQCLCRRVHMRYRRAMADCAFGEHVSFPIKFTLFIDDFKGTKQIIGRI